MYVRKNKEKERIASIVFIFQVLAKFPVIQHVFFGSLLPLSQMIPQCSSPIIVPNYKGIPVDENEPPPPAVPQ